LGLDNGSSREEYQRSYHRQAGLPLGGVMSHGLRRRFWLQSILGSVTGIVTSLTLVWHDWIEAVFRIEPDRGNGSAEWLVVVILLVFSAAFGVSARLESHRARLAWRVGPDISAMNTITNSDG